MKVIRCLKVQKLESANKTEEEDFIRYDFYYYIFSSIWSLLWIYLTSFVNNIERE